MSPRVIPSFFSLPSSRSCVLRPCAPIPFRTTVIAWRNHTRGVPRLAFGRRGTKRSVHSGTRQSSDVPVVAGLPGATSSPPSEGGARGGRAITLASSSAVVEPRHGRRELSTLKALRSADQGSPMRQRGMDAMGPPRSLAYASGYPGKSSRGWANPVRVLQNVNPSRSICEIMRLITRLSRVW